MSNWRYLIMKRLCSLLCLFYLLLISCSQSVDLIDCNILSFTADDARDYYYSALNRVVTKAEYSSRDSNFFAIDDYSILWQKARFNHSNIIDSYDFPTVNRYKRIVLLQDSYGYYLSECFHQITIIQTADGKNGAYNHLVIPFRSSASLIEESHNKIDGVVGKFVSNGSRSGFSGLELYTDLQGRIIQVIRYGNGRLIENYYSGNDAHRNIISYLIRSIIHHYFVVDTPSIATKSTSVSFSCPDCGAILTQTAVGYVCFECGWTEFSSMDGEINPSIIISDRNPTIDHGEDPSPIDSGFTGGDGFEPGGGGCSGEDRRDIELNKFHYDSTAISVIKPVMETLYEDCLGRTIINNISDMNIYFECVPGQGPPAQFQYKHGRYNVYYYFLNPQLHRHILIEELFHALQRKNRLYGEYTGRRIINAEIEAKMAMFLYTRNHALFEVEWINKGYPEWKNSYGLYIANPTPSQYDTLVKFTRQLNYPEVTFPDVENYRTFDNLIPFTSCTDYFPIIDSLFRVRTDA